MVQIIWTQRARNDLEQISEFISRDSLIYARNQIDKLYSRTEVLKQLPLVGKVVAEINDRSIREIVEGNYRIIYRIHSTNKLYILTVHHGARSLTLDSVM
ncbi:MAG: type II toxin-antitoxin system RelE/ParE family toxin [Flavobacteriales bacterium]|nr:type II toxin-antitoxin system RelE/ParE family toxin [Flavobacteriales bacterium]